MLHPIPTWAREDGDDGGIVGEGGCDWQSMAENRLSPALVFCVAVRIVHVSSRCQDGNR